MEKKTLPSYLPARLVQGSRKEKPCWYIVYYQTNLAGKRVRFKSNFDLNRIKSKKLRLQSANSIIRELNSLLPSGYPFIKPEIQRASLSTHKAIHIALKAKLNSNSVDTRNSYSSFTNILLEYIEKEKLGNIDITEFTRKDATRFMSSIYVERNIRNTTYNNYLAYSHSLFKELYDLEFIEINPFSRIKRKVEEPKKRRIFTNEERGIIAKYLLENDINLFRCILLIYYCLLRPIELRKLKFSMFDFNESVVHLPFRITKNKREKYPTIPRSILKYFLKKDFLQKPSDYFVFGVDLLANKISGCSKNYIYERHRKVLKKLFADGLLDNIEGLSLYSWKDTGTTDLLDSVSLFGVMNQAGHQDPKVTLRYADKKKSKRNEDIYNIENELII